MRYDWKSNVEHPEFSMPFFEEIDSRFLSKVNMFLPTRTGRPFDRIINYDNLSDQRVLEIDVGNGTCAGLLARHAKSFCGVDITNYVVTSTKKRFEVYNLSGHIEQMDAESLAFEDNSFDYVWSWGVIHHTANTENAVKEIARVLAPGGTAVLMVYYHNFWNYWICSFILLGLLKMQLFKGKTVHEIRQEWWDGALARFFTKTEWERLVSPYLEFEQVFVCGQREEMIPFPSGKLKEVPRRSTWNSAPLTV